MSRETCRGPGRKCQPWGESGQASWEAPWPGCPPHLHSSSLFPGLALIMLSAGSLPWGPRPQPLVLGGCSTDRQRAELMERSPVRVPALHSAAGTTLGRLTSFWPQLPHLESGDNDLTSQDCFVNPEVFYAPKWLLSRLSLSFCFLWASVEADDLRQEMGATLAAQWYLPAY